MICLTSRSCVVGSKQVRAGDGGSAEVRRMAKGDQVRFVWLRGFSHVT